VVLDVAIVEDITQIDAVNTLEDLFPMVYVSQVPGLGIDGRYHFRLTIDQGDREPPLFCKGRSYARAKRH